MQKIWVLQYRKHSAACHSAWANKKDLEAFVKANNIPLYFAVDVTLYEEGDLLKELGIKRRRKFKDEISRSKKRKRRSS